MFNPNKLKYSAALGTAIAIGGLSLAGCGNSSSTPSDAKPNDYKFIRGVESLDLEWGNSPRKLDGGEAVLSRLPDGREVSISIFANDMPDNAQPGPAEVTGVEIELYPGGTDITNIAAQPERMYLLDKGTTDNAANYDPSGLSTDAYYSGITQPTYPAPKTAGGDNVETSDYTVTTYTGRAIKSTSSKRFEAEAVLYKIESQALSLAAAASNHQTPPVLPEIHP